MPEKKSGLLIIKVNLSPRKLEELRTKLSNLKCVDEVNFNHLTGKLSVTHDGNETSEHEIRKAIGG